MAHLDSNGVAVHPGHVVAISGHLYLVQRRVPAHAQTVRGIGDLETIELVPDSGTMNCEQTAAYGRVVGSVSLDALDPVPATDHGCEPMNRTR